MVLVFFGCEEACGISVPQPGVDTPCIAKLSLNHWFAQENPEGEV